MNIADLISNFIRTERDRFSDKRNHSFAFGFGQIRRYYDFLQIILRYYDSASKAFMENTKLMQEFAKNGGKGWTEEQRKELDRGYELSSELHLHIESFYIFAKILLDKIAQAIYFYFGNSKTMFQSHHDMIGRIQPYVSERGLSPIPESLFNQMNQLKEQVSDFRDDVITHQYSPRAMKATMFNYTTGETWMMNHRIEPKEGEGQREGIPLTQLTKQINGYILEVINYLSSNKNKAYYGN